MRFACLHLFLKRKGAHAPGMDVAPILGLQINELRGIARIATVRFISGLVVSLSELESPPFNALKTSANSCLTCCSWLARHPKMRKLGRFTRGASMQKLNPNVEPHSGCYAARCLCAGRRSVLFAYTKCLFFPAGATLRIRIPSMNAVNPQQGKSSCPMTLLER